MSKIIIKAHKTLTFPWYVIPPVDKEPISALIFEDRGQSLCDKLRECVLSDLVHWCLVDHIGVI